MKLSIIVNMYNTAKYMNRCMETLLEQDIPGEEYEIIMVDDCSPDNSLEMANAYAAWSRGEFPLPLASRLSPFAQRPSMKVLHHEKNRGLAAGRNTGVDAAEGQYLCFVDPDDYIEKNSLAALLKQMDDEQLDILRFNYQKVDEDYKPVTDDNEEKNFDYSSRVMTGKEFLTERLGIRCYVWAYIYRTSLIKGESQEARDERTPIAYSQSPIAFIEGIYFDDVPWLPRILQRAARVNCVNVRHQYYLQRTGSMVHSHNTEANERKVEGTVTLLTVLTQHKGQAEVAVKQWYRKIESHLVVHTLTSASLNGYTYGLQTLKKLKELNLFPLSTENASPKSLRKIMAANTAPRLLLILLVLKNKRL